MLGVSRVVLLDVTTVLAQHSLTPSGVTKRVDARCDALGELLSLGLRGIRVAQRERMRAAHWAASPLARPSLVAPENVIIIAGEADVVTDMQHAQPLATHFNTPLTTFQGGHPLHLGRTRAFVPVGEMLRRAGLLDRAP